LKITDFTAERSRPQRRYEEIFVPVGPDGRRKTSRLTPVLQLSVAKKELAVLFEKTKLIRNFLFAGFNTASHEIEQE
jgi:hypothetical protein